jgi:hypothetical protein
MNASREQLNATTSIRRWPALAATLAVTWLLGLLAQGCAHDRGTPPEAFASPDDAVQALTNALRTEDSARLRTIVGSDGEQIVSSGDEVADKQRLQKFLSLYDEKHFLVHQERDAVTLVIGKSDWPFPVPVVRGGKGWYFDANAGREEIFNRRIGQNELSAIQVCKAIADAQHEYALRDPTGDGVHEYAQQFASDPGKRNGLYWPTAQGEESRTLTRRRSARCSRPSPPRRARAWRCAARRAPCRSSYSRSRCCWAWA